MVRPAHALTSSSIAPATVREFECLAAVIRAGSYKEAAHVLGLSPQTVKNHLAVLHRVTGLTTVQLAHYYRAQLALYLATVPAPPGLKP